ncbi:MAG: hypothetical protein FJ297_17665 [Planctomycetes bacterium]|nr:hypothetical protein [Planctomycetota bacterium]
MTDHGQFEPNSSADASRWAPKQHPLDRSASPEDPFELMAQPVAGDPEVMLSCILEEYLWMGWNAEQLKGLFRHPDYPVLGQLREHYGEEELNARIEALVARTGVLRFRETVVEPDEDELNELDELDELDADVMPIGAMDAFDLESTSFGFCGGGFEPPLVQLGGLPQDHADPEGIDSNSTGGKEIDRKVGPSL